MSRGIQKHVARLQVTVQKAKAVQLTKREQDLSHIETRRILVHATTIADICRVPLRIACHGTDRRRIADHQRIQIATLMKLHHEVECVRILECGNEGS